jgi:hypothetical protein
VCALLYSLRDRPVILICEHKKQEIGLYLLVSMSVLVLYPRVVWSGLLDKGFWIVTRSCTILVYVGGQKLAMSIPHARTKMFVKVC